MLAIGLVLIVGLVGVASGLSLSQADEKATVRASLRQLDGYEVENVRDQELLMPLSERALRPSSAA